MQIWRNCSHGVLTNYTVTNKLINVFINYCKKVGSVFLFKVSTHKSEVSRENDSKYYVHKHVFLHSQAIQINYISNLL